MNPTAALEVALQTALVLLPEALLAIVAIAMMTAGAFVRPARSTWCAIAALAIGGALLALVFVRTVVPDAYAAPVLNDPMSGYSRLVLLLGSLVLLALGHDQVSSDRAPEFFGALLLMTAGAMIVAAANEIVLLFAGLELVSIPTYLMLYLPRRTRETQEATTKYFYLSIFSSALLLFGLAYLYGMTGVSNLKGLAFVLYKGGALVTPGNVSIGAIAVVFVLAGLGFRVAAVPFHFYAPDVYQGAPTIVTATLAWVPKAVGFLAMLRALSAVVSVGNELLASKAVLVAWVIAAATLILGNTVALIQTDLKRLFAYSSIAHAGYLMIGLAVSLGAIDNPNGLGAYLGAEGILFYLLAYALMTLGAFGVILALNTNGRVVESIDDLDGLGRSQPALAAAMTVCLFSLAGIPPLAGFWGKFAIFASAWTAEQPEGVPSLRVLSVIGGLNAAIGAYYYLRLVIAMFFRPPVEAPAPKVGWPTAVAIGACATLSLVVGLYPDPIRSAASASAVAAVAHPDALVQPAPAPGEAPAAPAAPVAKVARTDGLR